MAWFKKMNEEDEVHYFEKKSIRKGLHLILKRLKFDEMAAVF